MISIATTETTLWLTIGAFLAFASVFVVGALQVFQAQGAERDYNERAAMMPSLAELGAIEASLKLKQQDLVDLDARLSELRREQAEADRHRLDAEHWRALAEQAQRDYELLGDKVKEIDALRSQFDEAAGNLAERRAELDGLLSERDRLSHSVEELRQRHAEAEVLDSQITNRRAELEKIREEVGQLEDQREELIRARFEVDQLSRRKSELEDALLRLPKEVEHLVGQKTELAREVNDLKDNVRDLRAARDEVDRLTERKLGLSSDIEALEQKKKQLESEIETRVVGQGKGGTQGLIPEDEHALDDLFRKPICLFDQDGRPLLSKSRTNLGEAEGLDRVREHLSRLNLQFDDNLLNRFHASLKSSRISPLTVLAGISGTGKSQLPQRYAEAMGIPFLKVAVQPRWDSPQDLLGFYNYLERRYKATELARSLVYVDGVTDFKKDIDSLDERMLLVLLDEMNIARVEYYFSEFLSRLEGRPRASETEEAGLVSGRLEIDIPSRDKTLSIYPGHNTLFVGTMNEDESTQALSDKVMDRSNIIRFKRPTSLEKTASETAGQPADHFLSFDNWISWQREPEELSASSITIVEEFVATLNDRLEEVQRPFGHRVNQAIFSYVANHPNYQSPDGVKSAIADMLRMRVLPKLRGVELEGRHSNGFRGVAELIENELGDTALAQSVRVAANPEVSTVFNWAGD